MLLRSAATALVLLLVCSHALGEDDDLQTLADRFEARDASREQQLWLIPRIAALGSKEARTYLTDRFLDGKDRMVRRALFRELLRAFPPLPRRVASQSITDPDPYLRCATLEALGEQSPEEAAERARDILRFDEDPRVRRTAIRLLCRHGDTDDARFVFETCARLGYGDQGEAIRPLAGLAAPAFAAAIMAHPLWDEPGEHACARLLGALILAERADPEYARQLQQLAKDGDVLVAFAAGLGVDRIAGRGRGAAVTRALSRVREPEERCRLLALVGGAGVRDPGLTKALLADLRHKDWRVRAAAADALRGTAPETAVEALVQRLRDEKVWQVQVACLEALGFSRSTLAIEYLLAALDELTGRTRRSARQALARLAGQDLGDTAEAWRGWWADQGPGFEPPPLADSLWADLDATAGKYAFYGIEVDSENVIFVLDVSGSMGGSKLVTLKKQLQNVIERLPAHARFNMIFFESKVLPWQERLVPLTRRNRAAALDSVRYLEAGGGTDLWGGMTTALADEQVDSIYLLTDGQPTAGEITSLHTICERLEEANRHRRVAIHVVMIDWVSGELKRLAIESGGSYTEQP